MHNKEQILKKGSKAFDLTKQLKNCAKVCFKEKDPKYEAAISNIEALEALFKPYALELERIQEETRQNELKLKQICAEKGHVGEWIQETYYEKTIIDRQEATLPFTRWNRICTRCGEKQVSEREPDEVIKLRKEREIKELEEKLKKMKEEL